MLLFTCFAHGCPSVLFSSVGQSGDFATTYVEELLAPVLKAVVEKAKIDPALVGDIVGTVRFCAFHFGKFSHVFVF